MGLNTGRGVMDFFPDIFGEVLKLGQSAAFGWLAFALVPLRIC
jgi:hypothetical protein